MAKDAGAILIFMENVILECSQIKKRFIKVIDELLRPVGFVRTKATWSRIGAIVHELTLTKSRWDDNKYQCCYYFDIRFYPNGVEPSFDYYSDCVGRVQAIPGSPNVPSTNFEQVNDDQAQVLLNQAIDLLANWYLPWVEKHQTLQSVKLSYLSGALNSFGTGAVLQEMLSKEPT